MRREGAKEHRATKALDVTRAVISPVTGLITATGELRSPELPLYAQVTPRDLGPGAAGIELEIGRPMAARVGVATELLKRHCQIEVRIRERRIGFDRRFEMPGRCSYVIAFEEEKSEVVVRFRLVAVHAQSLPIKSLGLCNGSATKAEIAEIGHRIR